ncbi:hypothetical protein D3C71_1834400 [compost metagenome]
MLRNGVTPMPPATSTTGVAESSSQVKSPPRSRTPMLSPGCRRSRACLKALGPTRVDTCTTFSLGAEARVNQRRLSASSGPAWGRTNAWFCPAVQVSPPFSKMNDLMLPASLRVASNLSCCMGGLLRLSPA